MMQQIPAFYLQTLCGSILAFFFFFVSIFLGDSLKETLAANVDREICVAVEFYQDENDNVLFCFCHYCWTRLILDPSFVLCN